MEMVEHVLQGEESGLSSRGPDQMKSKEGEMSLKESDFPTITFSHDGALTQ